MKATEKAVKTSKVNPSATRLTLYVNGQIQQVSNKTTLLDWAQAQQWQQRVALVVNQQLIPKSQWFACSLKDQDQLDVITAVQGG